MNRQNYDPHHKSLGRFDRHFFDGKEKFTYIGAGSIGGKASGLAKARGLIESNLKDKYAPDITIDIPTLTVIATDFFDQFMKMNDLYEIAYSEARDDLIAHAFQKAELPVQLVGDLRALVLSVHTPLAVRSSSMLEDALFEPFASVYETKMIPNNQPDPDIRFRKLVAAVKFVYASTFFNDARNYMKATHHTTLDEKMAVIIQEVIGSRYGSRFYPNISGVARSYNFYPFGSAPAEQGVIDLALGLGKTIVDDGISWSYSPASPKIGPPFNSIGDMLKYSQRRFWAVNLGEPVEYNPIGETEYLTHREITDAAYDGTLRFITSTYFPQDDRLTPGESGKGPKVIDFAPILKLNQIPLNDLLRDMLRLFEDSFGTRVEIEFAMDLDRTSCSPARFGFLQVRPMVVSTERIEIAPAELNAKNVLLASERVLGNGVIEDIRDIVYVKRGSFAADKTALIALQLDGINGALLDCRTPYLLIGFGRWGTSDPSGGIPVKFAQISGARVIVEASLPEMDFPQSQGSHFFHNVTSFKIFYFSIGHDDKFDIDWQWLENQKAVSETEFVRHVRLSGTLNVKVDGIGGRGVISHE